MIYFAPLVLNEGRFCCCIKIKAVEKTVKCFNTNHTATAFTFGGGNDIILSA